MFAVQSFSLRMHERTSRVRPRRWAELLSYRSRVPWLFGWGPSQSWCSPCSARWAHFQR